MSTFPLLIIACHYIAHFDVRKRYLVSNFRLRCIENLSSSTQVSSKEYISVKYGHIDIFQISLQYSCYHVTSTAA